jgi:hypothetical protein
MTDFAGGLDSNSGNSPDGNLATSEVINQSQRLRNDEVLHGARPKIA